MSLRNSLIYRAIIAKPAKVNNGEGNKRAGFANFAGFAVAHLNKYTDYNKRLDNLPIDERKAFVSDFIGIVGQYSNSILFTETHIVSKEHALSFTIAVWMGALCNLSPKQIINTLDDAINKRLVEVLSNLFRFHDRCKCTHI